MVVMCGLLIELCLITLVGLRYVVGWYAARVYFLVSSMLVLAVLLSETALLYARLARSVMAQRREREARLITMDVLSASIAQEMNQPLASIVTTAHAASRWMALPPRSSRRRNRRPSMFVIWPILPMSASRQSRRW